MTASSAQDRPLGRLADRLEDKAGGEETTVDEMMDAAGTASYSPLILLIALITITPIGSIPGASIITGVVLVLLGGQMLFSRGRFWLPRWIGRRRVKSERVKTALDKTRPVLGRIDRVPRPRMESVLGEPWCHAVAVGIVAMGLLMFPLAFVPWGVLVPAVALLVVSLGLMGRDGLLTAAGLVAMALAGAVSIYLMLTTFGG